MVTKPVERETDNINQGWVGLIHPPPYKTAVPEGCAAEFFKYRHLFLKV